MKLDDGVKGANLDVAPTRSQSRQQSPSQRHGLLGRLEADSRATSERFSTNDQRTGTQNVQSTRRRVGGTKDLGSAFASS